LQANFNQMVAAGRAKVEDLIFESAAKTRHRIIAVLDLS